MVIVSVVVDSQMVDSCSRNGWNISEILKTIASLVLSLVKIYNSSNNSSRGSSSSRSSSGSILLLSGWD